MEALTPDRVRKGVQHYARTASEKVDPLSPQNKGRLLGKIATAVKQSVIPGTELNKDEIDRRRRLVIGWVCLSDTDTFGELSSKDLTDGHWLGLLRWLDRETYVLESLWILNRAVHDLEETILAHQYGDQISLGDLVKSWELPDKFFVMDNELVHEAAKLGAVAVSSVKGDGAEKDIIALAESVEHTITIQRTSDGSDIESSNNSYGP